MTLKVVQLTDTHLFGSPDGEQKGVNTYQTLRLVVNDVAAHHPDFDALILTGDLSQDETPESYEALKKLLSPIHTAPIYAIPGNHEDVELMNTLLRGEDFFVLRDIRLSTWRIIMLNSRVPGRVYGRLGAEQVTRLKDSLRDATEHVIVAMHHPPVLVDSAWIDASRCFDGDELFAVIDDPPVKAVVCGHVHQVFETTRNGVAILSTPSTCVQFKPDADDFAIDEVTPGYRVFELDPDGSWSTRVHRVTPM
ncbi:MAG: 3',5'-cyclic adenosine monophosphate phosphodiesterase CpdA [Gammaproteobacteria bacterium]|nr:3',5'-cyclic adenosine monophosphate phosphodiesterase CpdA [Gammaproteobacteria bacterium]